MTNSTTSTINAAVLSATEEFGASLSATTKKDLIVLISNISTDMGLQVQQITDRIGLPITSKTTKPELISIASYLIGIKSIKESLISKITKGGGATHTIKTSTKELRSILAAQTTTTNTEEETTMTQTTTNTENTTTNTQEETTMTNNTPVTVETLNQSNNAMVSGILASVQESITAAMTSQTSQISELITGTNTRIDNAAIFTQSLAERITALEPAVKQDVNMETAVPVIEKPIVQVAQEAFSNTVEQAALALDTVVYSASDLRVLENAKKAGQETYEAVKESLDQNSRRLGKTVGNVLGTVSSAVDEGGHKGVDTIADFIDATIDSAAGIITQTVQLAAGVAHTATSVTRNAGHIIINGTVYTLDTAGNMVSPK